MKIIQFVVFGLVALSHFMGISQVSNKVIPLDTIELRVENNKFLVGSKLETIDSIKLSTVASGSLTDMINRYLPIYIKQDAGGLSTIRFRGTSPDHTAILFGGLNINSLTLGHSNMSNIPMFLFDDVKVQYGSSSSLYGTDAIGGSIQLDNKPIWNKGLSTLIQQDIGSFGAYFTGGKLDYSNNKIYYVFKAFYQQKKNDFPFLNIAVKDFKKDEFVDDLQKNAAIKNYGILQEFNYKISDKFYFFTKQWYQYNWHEIQPNMSSNYYGADYKEIENKNLRIVSGLNYKKNNYIISASLGYIYDYQLYNNNHSEIISTQSIIGNANYFNSNFWYGKLNLGVNYSHLTSDVYAYANKVKEDRFDYFLSYKVILIPKLTTALNLRESVVLDYTNKFSPSFGIDYLFLETNDNTLRATASVGKSFKIPTFNDRFWYPGGNPDLLSENGINYEIGLKHINRDDENISNFGISFFLMNIDNWIQWLPSGNIWTPQNIKMVQSTGVEFNFDKECKLSESLNLSWGVNYSYTDVSDVDGFWDFNFSERDQLAYTPQHIVNLFTKVIYKSWLFDLAGTFTGDRFTQSRENLDGYFLLNIAVGKNFDLKNNIISINLNTNNLLDKAYQNQAFYAMPGRNFNLSIKYLYR